MTAPPSPILNFLSTPAARYEGTLRARVVLQAFQRPRLEPSARDAIAIMKKTSYAESYSLQIHARRRKEGAKGLRAVVARGEQMGNEVEVATESRRSLRLSDVGRAQTSDER